MIKQISIYTENRKGALRTLVGTLAVPSHRPVLICGLSSPMRTGSSVP